MGGEGGGVMVPGPDSTNSSSVLVRPGVKWHPRDTEFREKTMIS